MKSKISLSEIEWKLMGALWKKGIMSVKEVWQEVYPNGEKAYTTVQTYLDRMVEKKLLRKEKIGLVNFYQPVVSEKAAKRHEIEQFVSRAFNGSFGSLAAFLVNSENLSDEDLNEIKQLITKREQEE